MPHVFHVCCSFRRPERLSSDENTDCEIQHKQTSKRLVLSYPPLPPPYKNNVQQLVSADGKTPPVNQLINQPTVTAVPSIPDEPFVSSVHGNNGAQNVISSELAEDMESDDELSVTTAAGFSNRTTSAVNGMQKPATESRQMVVADAVRFVTLDNCDEGLASGQSSPVVPGAIRKLNKVAGHHDNNSASSSSTVSITGIPRKSNMAKGSYDNSSASGQSTSSILDRTPVSGNSSI
jgi:hypothetical protein